MTAQEWLKLVHDPANTKYSTRDMLVLAEQVIKAILKERDNG